MVQYAEIGPSGELLPPSLPAWLLPEVHRSNARRSNPSDFRPPQLRRQETPLRPDPYPNYPDYPSPPPSGPYTPQHPTALPVNYGAPPSTYFCGPPLDRRPQYRPPPPDLYSTYPAYPTPPPPHLYQPAPPRPTPPAYGGLPPPPIPRGSSSRTGSGSTRSATPSSSSRSSSGDHGYDWSRQLNEFNRTGRVPTASGSTARSSTARSRPSSTRAGSRAGSSHTRTSRTRSSQQSGSTHRGQIVEEDDSEDELSSEMRRALRTGEIMRIENHDDISSNGGSRRSSRR